jgi:hypothetical protein
LTRTTTACRANHLARFGHGQGGCRIPEKQIEPRHKIKFACYLNQLAIPRVLSEIF